jgi:hypothetical protein
MRVVSYYNVVPAVNKSQEKFDILTKFIQGVNTIGDEGILHRGYNLIDADVAVIQGWQHQTGKNGAHLKLRQQVIETQINRKKYVCAADANLFLYANKSNEPYHYLRYSFNGVFPDSGIYFDDTPNPLRWQQISQDTGIVLEDRKTQGTSILICLQRNGGWSMGRIDVTQWLLNTIEQIRKHSDRPIVVRPHPGDKKAEKTYLPQLVQQVKRFKNVSFSNQTTPLEIDLNISWAVVNHNSSAIVGPIIKGYPAFITDPAKSQCREVAHDNFAFLESPKQFDRQRWLERISQFHWKFSELEDGTAWRHMRNYVRQ